MGVAGGPPALFIVGPTAAGKTEVALRLARRLGTEIVSLDSRQLYRGMDIGTAKPSGAERAAVRHHLIDVAAPDETLTLAEVLTTARSVVAGLRRERRVPVLVGGTGLYVRALVEGWEVPEVAPNPEVRARLEAVAEARGPEALHERLVALDPDAAARIHPRNVRRTVRALEVIEETGDRFSARRRARGPEFPVRLVGLRRSRDDLAERISRRVAAMLAAGLESEVRALVAAGYGFDLPAMSGVGYGEWAPYLAGTGDLADVATAIKTNTQRLARRQRLWFRGDDERIRWLDASGGVEAVVDEALRFATADHSEPRD